MDTCLEVWNTPFFLCRILVGLVVVLNRGKICIEKMLGFRGDSIRFFSTHVFVSAITWSYHSSKLSDSNFWVN